MALNGVSAERIWVLNTENYWKDTWTTIVPQKKIHILYLNLWPQKGGCKWLDSKRCLWRGWWTRWFKGYFCSTLWFYDSMIVCQKTNATAFHPSSRSEKDRARLQKFRHSIALLKVSAIPSHILKDLNAHTSCWLQRPKEKKKRKGKKKDDCLQDKILRGKCIKHFFYNCILQLFSCGEDDYSMVSS